MPKGFTYSFLGPYKKKEGEIMPRDKKGRFVARMEAGRETSLGKVATLLNEAADILVKKEKSPPAWLKDNDFNLWMFVDDSVA